MAHQKYYVVFHEGEWKISHDQKRYGPYPTQKAAYRKAVDTAKTWGDAGHQAQVFIQRKDNNEWRAEWTYGKDP
jgi:hypothetical protein